ncbi:MAG: tetratricopeptide repeat protein [Candidatus Eisenbacteria bacterium]|nr:tetratricopeptide repeat protein [Candidatus Eisenbacteria bacterium]
MRGIDRLGVLALSALAVGLRAATVVSMGSDPRLSEPILDGRYYLDLSARLAAGQGWPPGPHFMSPLLPALLSVVFRVVSATPLTVHLLHAALGIATGTLLALAARRDFGAGPGWCAAILFALCGPILAMEGQVLTESLLLFLGAAALWAWPVPPTVERPGGDHGGWIRGTAPRELLFGAICGCLTVGRATFALLPLAAVTLILVRRGRAGHSGLALVLAGLAVSLLPLGIHQSTRSGAVSLTTMNGGLNLYLGNNPAARGMYSLPPEVDLEQDITATRSASILAGRSLSQLEADRFWSERARTGMLADPARTARLLGRKALLFLTPREIPQIEDFQVLEEHHLPLRLAFVRFWLLLPLAVVGTVVLVRDRNWASSGWVALILIGWLTTTVFFATGRYRLPILVGFLGLAGVGLHRICLVIGRREGWFGSRVPLAAGVIVAATQFALPSYSAERARAYDAYQMGLRLQKADRLDEALASMRRATELDPRDATNWHGVGVIFVRQGKLREAAEAYRQAIAIDPREATTRYNLAIVLARSGQETLALPEFQAAVEIDPLDPKVRTDYGIALARTGNLPAAVSQWQEALRVAPGYAPAMRALQSAPPPAAGRSPAGS